MIKEIKTQYKYLCYDGHDCILDIVRVAQDTYRIMNQDGTFVVFCKPIDDFCTRLRFILYRPSNCPKRLYNQRLTWAGYILEAKGFVRKSKSIKQ